MNDSPKISIYTWQSPEWDIVSQPRDTSRVERDWKDEAKCLSILYPILAKRLKSDNFIWCGVRSVLWIQTPVRRLWELEVPRKDILAAVDTKVWQSLRECATHDSLEIDKSSLWDGLFVSLNDQDDLGSVDLQVLLRAPINPSWVVSSSRFSIGNHPNEVIGRLPKNLDIANRLACMSRREYNEWQTDQSLDSAVKRFRLSKSVKA